MLGIVPLQKGFSVVQGCSVWPSTRQEKHYEDISSSLTTGQMEALLPLLHQRDVSKGHWYGDQSTEVLMDQQYY